MATKIKCAPNGPLLVDGTCQLDMGSENTLEPKPKMALCRCGESANKPFCDGAHAKVGFSDARTRNLEKDERLQFEGEKLTIRYDRKLCSHAAHCVTELPNVFKSGRDPWAIPDNAEPEQVKEVIQKCPSGALSYEDNGKETIDFDQTEAKIVIARDGPFYIKGGIELEGVERSNGASAEHYALCRCGKSSIKPFCDGVHYDVKFKADGV